MVGLKISSEEINAIFPILGLSDDEQGKVYLSLLSLGMATLGQISLLSGLDYIKTREVLQILEGSKLVKRIPGKVGRYFALEPFLKAFFLAYDPITLVNIRKEASAAFEEDTKQMTDIFTEAIDFLQKNLAKLEEDFFQSMTPINLDFNELTNNFRETAEFSKKEIQNNINELKAKIQQVIDCFNEFNKEIQNLNLSSLEKIPIIFDPYTKDVEQKIKTLSETTSTDLKKLKGEYKAGFGTFINNVDGKIRENSESTDEVLNKFESNRSDEEQAFNDKIKETYSLLESLESRANQKKSNFLQIRQGYEEIDESVRNLILGLEIRLKNIEPLIKSSIDDIQSRKLFKGKEEFISNLTSIDKEREEISHDLENHSIILEKIEGLNNTLNESESEIVQATENGITELRKVMDEEVKLLSYDLQGIKQKICSEFKTSLKEFLENTRKKMITQIEDGEIIFDEKVNNFNQQLNLINNKFVKNISNLVQQTAEEFETELKTYFKKEPAFDVKKSSFEDTQTSFNELCERSNTESENIITKIADLEEKFSLHVSGLQAFTASFANTQIDEFNDALKKTEKILKSLILRVEQQLEHEISALTFSIKDMKQKLNKISQLSQTIEFSDVESSFLSSDLLIGETPIIMMLRDLTLRAKASLTILMPRPELQTLIAASKLPTRTRVSIIGDFRKVPESTLKKILSSANVRLKQLDTVDFWGCIRDAEELLVCPEPKDPKKEGLIGVITTNENLVELFSQELITYTTRSREIVL
ncbi:MAG: helix-turn-helix domain-containing protein [Candidatus Thorarchaeota archaeon]